MPFSHPLCHLFIQLFRSLFFCTMINAEWAVPLIRPRQVYSSMKFFTTTLAHGFSTPLHSLTILQWVLLLPFRFCFVPCNRRDYFVIEVHVKAGLPSEIYADGQNKVHIHVTFERIIRYTILKCGYACNILHRCG